MTVTVTAGLSLRRVGHQRMSFLLSPGRWGRPAVVDSESAAAGKSYDFQSKMLIMMII